MNENCIFCKIVANQLPSTRLFENEHVLAFMDIGPIIKGHTLVIPKMHYENLMETPPEELARVIQAASVVAAAIKQGLNADGVNLHQANGAAAGQVVNHLHFHVIPRYENDGHSWNWHAETYTNPGEMSTLAQKITQYI